MLRHVGNGIYRGPVGSDISHESFGIQTILNLESGVYARWCGFRNGWKDDDDALELRLPMNPILPPSYRDMRGAVSFMCWYAPGVFVHCKDGVDRTGVVCAAYRVWVQGWSVDDAMDEMISLGFHRYRFFWWLPFIRRNLIKGAYSRWWSAK